MDFASTLKQVREAKGLTQAALAERAELSLRTIQGWEQGRRSPVSPAFFKLAKALGVSCEAFCDCGASAAAPGPGSKRPKRKDR